MGDQTSRYKRFGGGGGAHRNASQTKKIINCGYKDEEEIASMGDGNGNSAFGEGEAVSYTHLTLPTNREV